MYLLLWKLFQELWIESLVLWNYLHQTSEILHLRIRRNWIFYWSHFLQTSGLPKKVERKVKVSELTILKIFPDFTLPLFFFAGHWQTVLVDQPYQFCYHSNKGEDCIRMILISTSFHSKNMWSFQLFVFPGMECKSHEFLFFLILVVDHFPSFLALLFLALNEII